MLYRLNAPLTIKGDRVEAGSEIELSDEEAKVFDPADVTPVDAVQDEEETEEPEKSLDEMNYVELQEKAGSLGLKKSGSMADLRERIDLHLQGNSSGHEDEEETEEGDETQPETVGHVVTQEDLDNNPELAEQGVQVGDTIQIPATDEEETTS